MKIKLFFASFALALLAFFSTPTQQAHANLLDGFTQSQEAQPLEMRRRGWGRGGGWGRRGYGRRHYGYRRAYRPRYYRPARYYYAPRMYCRTVIRYNRWGYPRRVRRCR
jgi:hypothetical protein